MFRAHRLLAGDNVTQYFSLFETWYAQINTSDLTFIDLYFLNAFNLEDFDLYRNPEEYSFVINDSETIPFYTSAFTDRILFENFNEPYSEITINSHYSNNVRTSQFRLRGLTIDTNNPNVIDLKLYKGVKLVDHISITVDNFGGIDNTDSSDVTLINEKGVQFINDTDRSPFYHSGFNSSPYGADPSDSSYLDNCNFGNAFPVWGEDFFNYPDRYYFELNGDILSFGNWNNASGDIFHSFAVHHIGLILVHYIQLHRSASSSNNSIKFGTLYPNVTDRDSVNRVVEYDIKLKKMSDDSLVTHSIITFTDFYRYQSGQTDEWRSDTYTVNNVVGNLFTV